jgi:hypothetical protein
MNRLHATSQPSVLAGPITATETQQHAELEYLQQIGDILGVGTGEDIVEMDEEGLPSAMVPEDFLLERLPWPAREHRLSRIQYRLVEEGDVSINRELYIGGVVAGLASFLVGASEKVFDLVAEGVGVGGHLTVGSQAGAGSEGLLKRERE